MSLSPARQKLAEAIHNRDSVIAALSAARTAHALASATHQRALDKVSGVRRAEDHAGARLAERIKAVAAGSGESSVETSVTERAISRAAAETEAASAKEALRLLSDELSQAEKAATEAGTAVISLTQAVLVEIAEQQAEGAQAAMAMILGFQRTILALEQGGGIVARAGYTPLRFPPGAREVLRVTLPPPIGHEIPAAAMARADKWRSFRKALETDPTTQQPGVAA